MPIFPESRYRYSITIPIKPNDRDVVKAPFIYTRNYINPKDANIQALHTVIEGDRLDRLAYKYAKDSTLWWVIADVNEIYGHPLNIPVGTKLKIPTRSIFGLAKSGGLKVVDYF